MPASLGQAARGESGQVAAKLRFQLHGQWRRT